LASAFGGRVDAVNVEEGESVVAGQDLVQVHPGATARTGGASHERIRAPLDGVVIYRSAEPGEYAAPGAPLLTLGDLERLNLTVYVPEDRYGQIMLGSTYPISVDSFPSEVFTGTVTNIADQAEFTPRNVQTVDNRKTTVFAIRLALAPSGGKLKPGMPADVRIVREQ
jgi:multidrug resistance efflux pump